MCNFSMNSVLFCRFACRPAAFLAVWGGQTERETPLADFKLHAARVRQKNLRESDLRKKVNRLRRKAVPIASSREGYFYASNAAELYSTIRQLKEMRAGLDAAICGLEQAMETFTEPSDGGGRDR